MIAPLRHPGRVALLVGAAALLNTIPIELPGNVRLFLGAFVYMPLVLTLPVPWAVLSTAIPMAVTIYTVGHPFALLLAVAEAAWLGLNRGARRRSALVYDALFWALLSIPAFRFLYHGLAAMPLDLVAIIAAKQIFNQLTAVGVAVFLVRHTKFPAWLNDQVVQRRRVRDTVFYSVFILAIVPLTVVGIGVAMLLNAYCARADRVVLVAASQRFAQQLDQFLRDHEAAVTSAAAMVGRGAEAGLVVEELRRSHPAFITMLVTDANGHITRTAPASALEKAAGTSVHDREYFQKARELNRTFVSGVFRGRGFGRDVLVAISAPVRDAEGRFRGIVEASLEVNRFAQLIVGQGDEDEIDVILADPSGRVIYAEVGADIAPLSLLRHSAQHRVLQNLTGTTVGFDQATPAGVSRMTAIATRAEKSRVLVIAQRPFLAGLEGSEWLIALFGGAAISILLAAVWVTQRARREMAAPLEEFAKSALRQAAIRNVEPIPLQQADMPYEVLMVYQRFNQLAVRLRGTYTMLRLANEDLDRRVVQRTQEAVAARQVAEKANQSKTDFLAMTSHEIRTPLNAIIGLAESLASTAPNAVALERLTTIRRSGQRLLTVVNDLLDLSKVEAGKLELHLSPVCIPALCEEIRGLFALRAQQQGIGFSIDCNPTVPPFVETDGARLQQVLINLVGNALKFTQRGRVCLRVQTELENEVATALRFAVVDTGPGIPSEQQARLFLPYVQLKATSEPKVSGTGLGLAISRRLVALLGGTLAVRSEAGAGAEFHFALLLRRVVATESSEPAPATPPPSLPAGMRILAIDDDVANQEVLRSMLESRCAHLTIVGSATEALGELARTDFDVALIDLEMPDADGFSVAAHVRGKQRGGTPRTCHLVACSAHPRADIWTRCAEAGFDDFVEKPIDRAALLVALRAAVVAPCL